MQVWSTIKMILANKKTTKRGFTLIELLVVIIILGVLATLSVTTITKLISSSKEKIFANEAVAFINAAKMKSAETIVPEEGLCYSISDLAEYIKKDVSDYSGSIYVSSDNKYKIWVSKNSYIINNGAIDAMDVVLVDGEIEASSICPSSFVSIVVNANGGTWNGTLPSTGHENQEIDLTDVEDPVKAGYIFSGWTVSGEGSSLNGNILTIGSKTVTLIANWTANSFTLTVNANGGTWSGTTPQTINYNATATINNPTKANYNFTGWTVSGTGSSIAGTTFTMGSEDATITANWTLKNYTLTVVANGGTWSGTTPQSLTYGQTSTISNPSKSGTVFLGWTVSGAESTMVGTTFTMGSANTTLTANWLTYSYIVNGNPGVSGTDYIFINDGSDNWRIKFLTSGTFSSTTNIYVEAFLVGGGGGGGTGAGTSNIGGSGGGGGYTKHSGVISLSKNTEYSIVIGNGGGSGGAGGSTTAFEQTAAGGAAGVNGGVGGAGGSGGGSFGASQSAGIYGGSDGSNGGYNSPNLGGIGQGVTTREFGIASATLYSGGGGAGAFSTGAGAGGAGGGGAGANRSTVGNPGTANTGGGGGGAGALGTAGGSGGSGIVVIRNSAISYQVGNTTKFNFTYTGLISIENGITDNWRIKFLSGGTFTPLGNITINAFLVGGGGGGGNSGWSNFGGTGGGGGYTTNATIALTSGNNYSIVVGNGGASTVAGQATSAFGYTANGGAGGTSGYSYKPGAAGGSGGGAVDTQAVGKNGGSNGGNGVANGSYAGGVGQGTTTRAFADPLEELFSGGGGSGAFDTGPGTGGAGGGGNGGTRTLSGYRGEANTGGGGGGSGALGTSGGVGGSGIVIIRKSS